MHLYKEKSRDICSRPKNMKKMRMGLLCRKKRGEKKFPRNYTMNLVNFYFTAPKPSEN